MLLTKNLRPFYCADTSKDSVLLGEPRWNSSKYLLWKRNTRKVWNKTFGWEVCSWRQGYGKRFVAIVYLLWQSVGEKTELVVEKLWKIRPPNVKFANNQRIKKNLVSRKMWLIFRVIHFEKVWLLWYLIIFRITCRLNSRMMTIMWNSQRQ